MAPPTLSFSETLDLLRERRHHLGRDRALLAGLSGIDGAGKGWVATRLGAELETRGLRVASINADGWLNLPSVRFNRSDPARHFYRHALRLDELAARLLLPLRTRRSVDLVAEFAEETATRFRPHRYQYQEVDVILAEGIYLFKREYRPIFDLAIWVDCSYETALERALARGQEGLPPEEAERAYRTIYFPAQDIHAAVDQPRAGADGVLRNDPRLG